MNDTFPPKTESPHAGAERRKPTAAGIFYPAEPGELAKSLSGLFATVKRRYLENAPIVLIAPHSALDKSGDIAAVAFASLLGFQYDTVVVIGPSHNSFFPGVSVYDGDFYATPLGDIAIDKDTTERLTKIMRPVYASGKGHSGEGHRGEFTVETVLPFLQLALGKFPLVAILTGDKEISSARALGECLFTALAKRNALVVVSTDLSHFSSPGAATALDDNLRRLAHEGTTDAIINQFLAKRVDACGIVGLIGAFLYAEKVGIDERFDLGYRQSQVTDENEVIGHSAFVITRSAPAPVIGRMISIQSEPEEVITTSDCELLRSVARETILARLEKRNYQLPAANSQGLTQTNGVFVTIRHDGSVVGRAGYLRSRDGILTATRDAASSAFFDSRAIDHSSVSEKFEQYAIEVDILSPLERTHALESVDFRVCGVMVKLELSAAYMFPDEFAPEISTPVAALEAVCLKAQLPKNSYRDRNAEVYTFRLRRC